MDWNWMSEGVFFISWEFFVQYFMLQSVQYMKLIVMML